MELTANLRERVKKDSVIRVKRSLSGAGRISVQPGQELLPQDILGQYQLTAGFVSINIAKPLGVSGKDAESYIQRKKGEKIYKGELLAMKSGLFGKKVLTSPTDGVLEEYNSISGELKMKYLPKNMTLTAGVYGIVEEVNAQNGEVIIKTMATEVYGVFGSGKERSGILKILSEKSNLMGQNQVERNMKGQIIVTGALVYREALQHAVAYGVAGIISGGLNSHDFISMSGRIDSQTRMQPSSRVGTDIGISVVAVEGFGPIQVGEDIFEEINEYDGKFVFISGNSAKLILPVMDMDIIMTLRNIVLPPRARVPEKQAEVIIREIIVGSKIRIIWPPFVGSQGKVVDIDKTPTTLPSGVSTYMLTVETPHKKIKVPYPNVELIR